jgi:hypothetical protein
VDLQRTKQELSNSMLEISKLKTEALSHSVAADRIFKKEQQEKQRFHTLNAQLQGKLNSTEAELISLSAEVSGLQDDLREARQIVRDLERQIASDLERQAASVKQELEQETLGRKLLLLQEAQEASERERERAEEAEAREEQALKRIAEFVALKRQWDRDRVALIDSGVEIEKQRAAHLVMLDRRLADEKEHCASLHDLLRATQRSLSDSQDEVDLLQELNRSVELRVRSRMVLQAMNTEHIL